MNDIFTLEKRSEVMGRIRSSDTRPEMMVRRLAHAMGYRYRLHRRDLPGTPDLLFPGRRKVVFVHGCFWHRHEDCRYAYRPKTRVAFWDEKFRVNVERDRRALAGLENLGWDVFVIWECETRNPDALALRLREFLEGKV